MANKLKLTIGDKSQIVDRIELEKVVYTEHSLDLALFMEVHYRIYVAARLAIEHAKKDSSFLNGAYLRMILDSAAELFIVNSLGLAGQKRYLRHWKEGKPNSQFKVEYNGNKVQLTTGFLQREVPIFKELYEALNAHIHPSLMYYNRVIKMDADSIFINEEVPTEDLSGLEGAVFNLFDKVQEDYKSMMDKIHPTTTEYRIVRYSDTLMEFAGQEPIEIKVYKD